MSRKQWINNISDEEATKIHLTFKQVSKTLSQVPVARNLQGKNKVSWIDHCAARRKAVRQFLRANHFTERDLNVQYGRLAAGLNINLKCAA